MDALIPRWFSFRPAKAVARTAVQTKPRKYRPPVLIHDAVTPWQDETLLLALTREDETDQP
ncbi:MAG: hypothetical protein AAFR45_08495 [Pseudomonadota bacterium]